MSLTEVIEGNIKFSDNGDDLFVKIYQCSAVIAFENHKAIVGHFHPYKNPEYCIDYFLDEMKRNEGSPLLEPFYIISGNNFYNQGYIILGETFALNLYNILINRGFLTYIINNKRINPKIVIVSPKINKISILNNDEFNKLMITSGLEYENILRSKSVNF